MRTRNQHKLTVIVAGSFHYMKASKHAQAKEYQHYDHATRIAYCDLVGSIERVNQIVDKSWRRRPRRHRRQIDTGICWEIHCQRRQQWDLKRGKEKKSVCDRNDRAETLNQYLHAATYTFPT